MQINITKNGIAMGFVNKLINKLTKNKKIDTVNNMKTEEKVEKVEERVYEYYKYDLLFI